MIKRPPEHAADAVPLWIAPFDDAIDVDRIERERKELSKGDEHCVDRYWSGATRYDIDAPHTVGGAIVTMRSYIRDGAVPTVFKLRRDGLTVLRQQTLTVMVEADGKSQKDVIPLLHELARKGVVSITDGFGGEAWDIQGGQGGRPLTEGDMQALYDASPRLPEQLGLAVFHASAPLSEAEGKP
jgi:hypothetical protein